MLFQAFNGRLLDGDTIAVILHELLEALDILRIRIHRRALKLCENLLIKKLRERRTILSIQHVQCKQRHTPRATLGSRSHDCNRRIDCCRKIVLRNTLCLEKTAMPHDPVKLYMLLLKKDIHAELYRTEQV